jgi:hypothetical protein
MDEKGKIFGGVDLPQEFEGRGSLGYEDIFPFLVRHKNVLLRTPTFMARQETLAAVGLFEPEKYGIAADLEMWLRIARQFPIAVLNERLMRYRVSKRQWSYGYKHLRTEPEAFFHVMDTFIDMDGWRGKLSPTDLIEYNFHRCDDETSRAANFVLRGKVAEARELLRQPYPWPTLFTNLQRRKLRVLLLRALMQAGLSIGAMRPLAGLLGLTEYGGRV